MPESLSTDLPSSPGLLPGRFSIEAEHLVKRYGAVVAVDDVGLRIRPGEFFSLLGPSGAGKTSILRMLAGFETPDTGTLSIEGQSMAGVPAHRRPVNLVFQSYALFPHLRVAENIAFGLEMKRRPRPEILERVADILAMVKLSGKEHRWPHELSGGEQQRVALARALVNRPAVLLLDEPLSALDQQLRQEMQVELKSIQEQVGITFVCVTHHQQEALAMSDRVGVMQQGRLVQVGTPREVYDQPASLSVARFIGESNELSGLFHDIGGGYGMLAPSFIQAPAIKARCARKSESQHQNVVLSLRPEHLRIFRGDFHNSCDNRLPGRIEKALYGGHETHYMVRVSEEMCWKVVTATPRGDDKPFAPGEQVFLSWRADDGLIFPE
ncbi:ABC transporter ATP-binding protein [Nitrospira sp. Nam80]